MYVVTINDFVHVICMPLKKWKRNIAPPFVMCIATMKLILKLIHENV